MKKLRLLAFVLLSISLPANAAAPLIWGPFGSAKLLNSGPLVTSGGTPFSHALSTNYVANPSGSIGASNWTASGTMTVSRVTTGLPRDSIGTGLSLAAGTNDTDYVQTCFTIDSADENKKLGFSWDQAPGSFTASDIKAQVYSFATADCGGTATQLAIDQANDSDNLSYDIPNATGSIPLSFDTSSNLYYGIRYLRHAGTSTLVLANVSVSPDQTTALGPVVTSWQSFTPVLKGDSSDPSLGTGATDQGYWRRVGDTEEFTWYIVGGTSATAGSGSYYIQLPNNDTIDTAKIISGGAGSPSVGVGTLATSGGGNYALTAIAQSSGKIRMLDTTGSAIGSGTTTYAMAANVRLSGKAEVPIAGWDGTVNIGQNNVLYYYGTGGTWGTTATITTAIGEGGVLGGTTTPSGSSFTWTFTPSYPIQTGEVPQLQVSPDAIHWSNVPNNNTPHLTESYTYDGTNGIGATANVTSTGDIYVIWGKYAAGGSTTWSGTWYWRVAVGFPGQLTGFGLATATSSGLYKATLFQTKALTSSVTTTPTDVTDLQFSNLTVGQNYRISGQLYFGKGGASTTRDWQIAFYSATGGSGTEYIHPIYDDDGITSTAAFDQTYPINFIFTAVSSTIVPRLLLLGGSGWALTHTTDGRNSFLTIEELPSWISTTKFN